MGFSDRDDFTAIFGADTGRFGKALLAMENRSQGTFAKIAKFAIPATAAFATLALGISASIAEFTKYEKALIGVAKTTNLAGDELADFSDDIKDLSVELKGGASSRELLAIAEAAGQLGVQGSENLLAFSKTIAQLGLTTDLAGNEAAITLARILTVTGEGAEGVAQFASQLVALGNNFAATESEIALIAQEIAKATSQFNVGAGDAAALGAALKSMGVQAEAGSTVIGKAFRAINKVIRGGGEGLDRLSILTGKTREEITKTFKEDSPKAFQFFIEGLGKIQKSGGDVSAELAKFGLIGERVLKVLPTLAKESQLLGRALNTSRDDAASGGKALKDEYGKAVVSLDTQIKNLNDRFKDLLTTSGKQLAPEASASISFLTFLVNQLNEGLKETEKRTVFVGKGLGAVAAGKVQTSDLNLLKRAAVLSQENLKNVEKLIKKRIEEKKLFKEAIVRKEKLAILEKQITKEAAKNNEIISQHLQFQDALNDQKKAQEILDNESFKLGDKANQNLERELSLLDKILDQKKEELKNDEMQDSLLDKQVDRQIQSLALTKKIAEEEKSAAKIAKDKKKSDDFFSGIGKQAASQILGASGAIEGFQAAGPVGAIIGALLEVALANDVFKGSVDDLNDQIGETLSPIMEELAPINESLVEILEELTPIVKELAPVIRALVKIITIQNEGIRRTVIALKDTGGKIAGAGKDVVEAVRGLGGFFKGLGDAIVGLKNVFTPLIDAVIGLKNALGGAAGGAGGAAKGFVGKVGNALGFADGGISTGPKSGHVELLHDTEAVIPMKGGSIPVQIQDSKNNNTSLPEQNMMHRVVVEIELKDNLEEWVTAKQTENEILST